MSVVLVYHIISYPSGLVFFIYQCPALFHLFSLLEWRRRKRTIVVKDFGVSKASRKNIPKAWPIEYSSCFEHSRVHRVVTILVVCPPKRCSGDVWIGLSCLCQREALLPHLYIGYCPLLWTLWHRLHLFVLPVLYKSIAPSIYWSHRVCSESIISLLVKSRNVSLLLRVVELIVVCIAIDCSLHSYWNPRPSSRLIPFVLLSGVRPGCQGKSLLVLNSDADTYHDLIWSWGRLWASLRWRH